MKNSYVTCLENTNMARRAAQGIHPQVAGRSEEQLQVMKIPSFQTRDQRSSHNLTVAKRGPKHPPFYLPSSLPPSLIYGGGTKVTCRVTSAQVLKTSLIVWQGVGGWVWNIYHIKFTILSIFRCTVSSTKYIHIVVCLALFNVQFLIFLICQKAT